jgi:hypothetical protein
VLYREFHSLLDELSDAVAEGTRKEYIESVATVSLLILDDFGMRKLPHTAPEDLLEIIMRRYERFSTLLTSNRPVEDWGKLLGDVAAVSAMLDRVLHDCHAAGAPRPLPRIPEEKTSLLRGRCPRAPGIYCFRARKRNEALPASVLSECTIAGGNQRTRAEYSRHCNPRTHDTRP